MLYLLGYENRYINLYHLNKEYINNIPKDISHNDYLNLIRDRINNLKQMINRSQSIIFNIANSGAVNSIYNVEEKKIISEFTNRIKNFKFKENTCKVSINK